MSKSKRSKKTKSTKSFASEEKQERVETLKVRGKHGTAHTAHTPIPITVHSLGRNDRCGYHSSIDEPPSVPMFQGKARQSKAKAGDNEMATVFTEMAKSCIGTYYQNVF